MPFTGKKTHRSLRDLRKDCSGAAAVEFCFIAAFLSLAVVNVADIGIYLYKRMEVENAALVGSMSAVKACDPSHLPATINCPTLTAAVTASIQSTSLGAAVTLSGGGVTEGYYCINASNALQYMSDASSKPTDCSAAGMAALQPADYVLVTVTYSYAPLFGSVSVAGTFGTPIVAIAIVRML